MRKTLVAIMAALATISANADPLGTGCQTIFDFNTGKYTKICCTPSGQCTVYQF